jgi:hypothetical protein
MLLAHMRPHRIGIEHAAGNRRIAAIRHLLQQGIGDPAVGHNTRIDLLSAEKISNELPAIDAVQSSAGQSGDNIEA